MQAIQCSKGHFYDQSLGQCPKCAEEARKRGGSMGMGADVPDFIPIPNTAPVGISATAPVEDTMNGYVPSAVPPTMPTPDSFGSFGGGTVGGTVPVTNPGFTPTDFVPTGGGTGWQVDDYGETQPNGVTGVAGFDPIVGWLVCVKGPNRGRDYRLHSGTNYIGSSKEMDICIDNDKTISRHRAASISYDEKGQVFFIQKGEGRNLIYLNGSAVRSDADLAIYDHIVIGSTELVFVPLCCEKFSWQEV